MRELKDPKFISSLTSISINQLPIKPPTEVPKSPAVWFALDDKKTVLYVGQAENLNNSLSSHHPKMEAFQENGVSSIAYYVVKEKPANWAKEAKKEFNPPLNQNRSQIFIPAINSLIKHLKNESGLKQKEITMNADNIGLNFLNDFDA
jgi:hypothetical protein